MSKLLYEKSEQLGEIEHAADPGYDVVPGNVLKVALVLLGSNPFTAANIITQAGWDSALDADPVSVFVTKYIDGFSIPPTELITEGGNDATTYNGVPRARGIQYATATGKLSGVHPDEKRALRRFASKSGNFQRGTRVGVIFLYEGGGIGAQKDGSPFPAYNVYALDPNMGGQGASFDVNFGFHMEGGWSDNFELFQAETGFVPSALVNPEP